MVGDDAFRLSNSEKFLINIYIYIYREIIVYSRSTINAYSLLSHEWWVPLIKFIVGPTIHMRRGSAHLWYSGVPNNFPRYKEGFRDRSKKFAKMLQTFSSSSFCLTQHAVDLVLRISIIMIIFILVSSLL